MIPALPEPVFHWLSQFSRASNQLIDAISNIFTWDGWSAAQSTEFAGAVVGAALSVGLGFVISDWKDRRRGADQSKHVRGMVIQEVLLNHHLAIRLRQSVIGDDGIDPTKFVRMPGPAFLDIASSYLLQVPEAITLEEMKNIQEYRLAFETIRETRTALQTAYLFDLESQRSTTEIAGIFEPTRYISTNPTYEFKNVWEQSQDSIRSAFDVATNQPHDWIRGLPWSWGITPTQRKLSWVLSLPKRYKP